MTRRAAGTAAHDPNVAWNATPPSLPPARWRSCVAAEEPLHARIHLFGPPVDEEEEVDAQGDRRSVWSGFLTKRQPRRPARQGCLSAGDDARDPVSADARQLWAPGLQQRHQPPALPELQLQPGAPRGHQFGHSEARQRQRRPAEHQRPQPDAPGEVEPGTAAAPALVVVLTVQAELAVGGAGRESSAEAEWPPRSVARASRRARSRHRAAPRRRPALFASWAPARGNVICELTTSRVAPAPYTASVLALTACWWTTDGWIPSPSPAAHPGARRTAPPNRADLHQTAPLALR